MTRILSLAALLASLAACAPPLPAGTAMSRAELQSALPGHVSDFGNGVLIIWNTDGSFIYNDRLDNSGTLDTRVAAKWGPGGTYTIDEGRVCLAFPAVTRCDGMIRTASGGLVATILGWPYAVTLH